MTQPEALRLADALMEAHPYPLDIKNAAAELRRLHAENERLHQANEAFSKRQEWWNEKMFALEQQRGVLLEALIRCRDRFFPADQPERDRDELWEPVNAAIKAVEEGK